MDRISRVLLVAFIAACFTSALQEQVTAQYPVAVVPAVAPVGYAAERRGLFGRRVVIRPLYAPVTAAVPVAAPVTVARPVIASPIVTAGYAPAATVAPVRAYYAPPVAPVTTYRVPVTSYRVPVTSYRVPVTTYPAPVTTYMPPMIHF